MLELTSFCAHEGVTFNFRITHFTFQQLLKEIVWRLNIILIYMFICVCIILHSYMIYNNFKVFYCKFG